MQAPAESARPQRPDASMSLLTDIFRGEYHGGIADEYRLAADRRTDPPGGRARGRQVVLLVIGVVILGLLLAVTAKQTRQSAPAAAAERQSLVERVQEATKHSAALKGQLDSVQADLSALQEAALATTTTGEAAQQKLDLLSGATGAAAVTGPGIRITIDDAPEDDEGDGDGDGITMQEGRVIDLDLQQLVNGLWAAGAEAVAVDGQRVTARTSIRMAGDAIFMDLLPLTRPYEVVAVGDPSSLAADFVDTYGGAWMQTLAASYGIRFDVVNDDSMTLPAASAIDIDLAQPVAPSGAPASEKTP